MGSLRKNLCSVAQMEWKHRLTLLHSIASDLQIIHSQGLIHRDLHSCNILQDDLKSAYITDLGLAISTNKAPEEKGNGIYGILPFIAPEVLNGGHYTTASDIYSFGIILWEILYGKTVSFNDALKQQLMTDICLNDLRPTIIEDSPQCYISLMKKCWDKKPMNRPSAIEICEIFTQWQSDENILLELRKSNEVLKNIENIHIHSYSHCIYKDKNTNSDDNLKSSYIGYTASCYQDTNLNELYELEIGDL
ncbi:kinase-like domain-containing protein [Gigaspora rosea]|uniref:Kinase-like domain-containing protein n=1 Tax=Gigaspora rosea TaxID=44941 RepID=A0A397USN7_9GLOM|nr:kinase-like domain-containing protein [Gigaspora rosea]